MVGAASSSTLFLIAQRFTPGAPSVRARRCLCCSWKSIKRYESTIGGNRLAMVSGFNPVPFVGRWRSSLTMEDRCSDDIRAVRKDAIRT